VGRRLLGGGHRQGPPVMHTAISASTFWLQQIRPAEPEGRACRRWLWPPLLLVSMSKAGRVVLGAAETAYLKVCVCLLVCV
jgi:hypothetical protein